MFKLIVGTIVDWPLNMIQNGLTRVMLVWPVDVFL